MIRVKKKKKIKRKRVGNVRTTERTTKKGGNVSQVVNVYVTKGGGGRRKAPAQRPTFFQSQPQLFTANYDNTLLNQIQPIQDKYIKMFNTNNDLLNKLLTKQRTSDSSIQTDTLTNDKLFTKETQTTPEKIPVFRPADTQTEPMIFNTTGTQSEPTLSQPIETQTEPIQSNVIETQTEPTLTQARRIQTEPSLFQTTGTQSGNPLQTIGEGSENIQQEEGDLADLLNPTRPQPQRISGERVTLDQTKEKEKKKIKIRIKKSIKKDRPNVSSDFVEGGGVDVISPLEELKDLVMEDFIQNTNPAPTPPPAEEGNLQSQLSDLKIRAKANNIKLRRGMKPKTPEAIRNQIRYYSEAIAIKNRATSI